MSGAVQTCRPKIRLLTLNSILVTLPADFGVWAATDEAKFLHGRWVDAHWDIDEVKGPEIRKVLEEDKNFMRIGLSGVTDTTGWPTQ